MSRRLTFKVVESAAAIAIAAVALLIGLMFVAASGVSPTDAVTSLWDGAFGTSESFAGVLAKMVPLILVALGWIFVFKAGRFHVGFPGQIIVGGIFATFVGIRWADAPLAIHLPAAVVAAILGGMLYAGIAAWLWARRGVNEILSTLLLNLIALQLLDYLVTGPMRAEGVIPTTDPITDSARWPELYAFALHWDIVLVPVIVAAAAFILSRTRFGARVRLLGANERFARNCGVSVHRVGAGTIVLSGGLAGLAGASILLAGDDPGMSGEFEGNYGFDGIAVALLARNSPWATLPAALLVAVLRQGGDLMEAQLGVSSALIDVTQGIVILLVLGATTMFYAIHKRYAIPAPTPGGTGPAGPVTEEKVTV